MTCRVTCRAVVSGGKAIRSASGSDVVLEDGETTLCRSAGVSGSDAGRAGLDTTLGRTFGLLDLDAVLDHLLEGWGLDLAP